MKTETHTLPRLCWCNQLMCARAQDNEIDRIHAVTQICDRTQENMIDRRYADTQKCSSLCTCVQSLQRYDRLQSRTTVYQKGVLTRNCILDKCRYVNKLEQAQVRSIVTICDRSHYQCLNFQKLNKLRKLTKTLIFLDFIYTKA